MPPKRTGKRQLAAEVFTNPVTGMFGRSPLQMAWRAPDVVRLDGTKLRFDRSDQGKEVTPPADFVDRVLALATAADHDAERFAQRFGVIVLCEEHKLPLSHRREAGNETYPCELLGRRKPYVPVDWLPNFARRCSAVLRLAANLQEGVAGVV